MPCVPLLLELDHAFDVLCTKAAVLLHPTRHPRRKEGQIERIIQNGNCLFDGVAAHQRVCENDALIGMPPHHHYFVLQQFNLVRLVCLNVMHDVVAEETGIHILEVLEVVIAATEVAEIENVVVAVVSLLSMTCQHEAHLHHLHCLLVGMTRLHKITTVNSTSPPYSKFFKDGIKTTPRSVSAKKSTSTDSWQSGQPCVSIVHCCVWSKLWPATTVL